MSSARLGPLQPVVQAAKEALLLREAEAVARRVAPRHEKIRALADAAERRASAARTVESVVAASLCRDAVLGFVIAHLIQEGKAEGEETVTTEQAWKALDAWKAAGTFSPEAERGLAALRPECFRVTPRIPAEGAKGQLSDDVLEGDDIRHRELLAATSAVRRRVVARSVREIQIARALRLALLGLVAVALLAYAVVRIRAPKNLARGRLARASSASAGAPFHDPAAITNGEVEPAYALHTAEETNPWIEVELPRVERIAEVRIFNRGDAWARASMPLALELSDDGVHFHTVAATNEDVHGDVPWRVFLTNERARLVRVTHQGRGYMALSEIEVYGP